MEAIRRFQTKVKKMKNVGAHLYVSPDGLIWNGCPLNLASEEDSQSEPPAVHLELIGDFNKGKDELSGPQLYAAAGAIRFLLSKFRLNVDQVLFHSEKENVACPGSGIDKAWFIAQVMRWPNRPVRQMIRMPETKPAAIQVTNETNPEQVMAFIDLPNNEQAKKALLKLYKKGVIQPEGPARLGTAKPVTREELALALQLIYNQLKR
jgi:hypothetical protein